ncbi:receptor-interacting serine/threonine-protein kinase 1 [Fundulus heteroclitus]|uniref:receptor-interacting serine/threonine-protein kinase 1 n=1 Tax=Fundulus heteroclitus TaxID=8078 RepID=UPI00165BFE4D|nr:receptor-interacting serine/threonine-protein kinase 1 [Fundulus heteroclitus]
MATAPPTSLHMRSADLIKKEPLDYGGFGEVYLCYHATLGQVVLKTVYTGPLRNEESKKSLLEEGSIMAGLDHKRVVKLLGVIMEDRDCSLVIELLPRGNLLVMLEKVRVPMSIKGRIILEILEGMVYLTERQIIHKDIKPENILVDKDFHIKIADLGLATCQAWSKLTKQESRRKSFRGTTARERGAGTLSYMAPEHLESIHTPSTVKSDVYSFAIVVWVILMEKEPYENARSEDHISQCVRNGDRPSMEHIPEDTPPEIINLMKSCWAQNPVQRPTFKEAYDSFLPFYKEKLEPHEEHDLWHLREQYEGPDELVEKIKSLSMTQDGYLATDQDGPASLTSHRDLSMPVEASIEDLHNIHNQASDSVEADARGNTSELEEKLDREFHYHKHGSYACNNQPESAQGLHKNASNPFLQNPFSESALTHPAQEKSSVHSWTKPEQVQPASQTEGCCPLTSGLHDSMNFCSSNPPHLHTSVSTSSLSQFNQQHPHSHLDRQQSWPTYPVPDTFSPNQTAAHLLTTSKSGSLNDSGSLYFHNASGIQIGNNNTMSIRACEPTLGFVSVPAEGTTAVSIQEGILKYDDHMVTEAQLDVLRENIGMKWKRCARGLGLTEVEIETIEHDYYRDGLPEMVHQMLEHWRMKQGSISCTIGRLCRALSKNIKVDVIQKILDLCDSSQ